MVGLLLDKVFKIAKEELKSYKDTEMISKGQVAGIVVKDAKKPETAFARLLKGKQSGYHWVGIARRAMMYVMVAEKDSFTAKVADTAKRIDHYFFRGTDKGCPRYFAEERRLSAHAWSYPELAGELNWLARGKQGEVVFLSGGPAFVEGDKDDQDAMLQALKKCTDSGIKVTFILPDLTNGDAANSVDRVRSITNKFEMHVVKKPPSSLLTSFLTPATRYLFLDHPSTPSLWVLRSAGSDGDLIEQIPRAYYGVATEQEAFRSWLTPTIKELQTLASPLVQKGSASAPKGSADQGSAEPA